MDYDITLIRRIGENSFTVYTVYPNEDNGKRTPVIWTAHHDWNPDECSLHDFIYEVESKAYIDEENNSLEEVFEGLLVNSKNFVNMYNTDEELEAHAKDLRISEYAMAFYLKN